MQFKSLALLAMAAAAPAVLAQTPASTGASLDPAALASAAAALGLTNATTLACITTCTGRAAETNNCPRGISDPGCYCERQQWLDDSTACTMSNCTLTPAEQQGGMALLNQTCTAALAPRPYNLTVHAGNATTNSTAGNHTASGNHTAGTGGNRTNPSTGRSDGALGARVDNKQLFVAVTAGLGGSIVAGLSLL